MENQEVNFVLWIGTLVTVTLGCGLIFLVLFYQNYVIKMRRREAENLLHTALESEKKERVRIAADIHDGVSGDLNAVRNFVTILQSLEADPDKKGMLNGIRNGIEAALGNTRQISYKLMPPLLETAGLRAALSDYFDRLAMACAIDFEIEAKGDLEISSDIAYELFRIVQEFTTNMMKYGQVKSCKVILEKSNGEFRMEILDDGLPFDFEQLFRTSKGAGLSNIKSRVSALKAQMRQLKPEHGNHFTITLKQQP